MLSVQLMLEANRRCGLTADSGLLRDASLQAAYCLDAPHQVQDGMEWWQDPQLSDLRGPVPRMVALRELADTGERP